MAGLFAKASEKKAVTPTKTKKSTTWLVGDTDTEKIAKSVDALIELSGQAKAVEAKMGIHKNIVRGYAEKNYVRDYATTGVSPETPMIVQTTEGAKVTFVLQDRSSQYQVKEDQQDALKALLGEDAAADLLYTETTFGFSRDILAIPGVMDVVEKALESAIKKLTDDKSGKPLLTEEQAEMLLDVKSKTAFKPGTLDRLSMVCGRDAVRIEQMLEIMGSSATRYVKP